MGIYDRWKRLQGERQKPARIRGFVPFDEISDEVWEVTAARLRTELAKMREDPRADQIDTHSGAGINNRGTVDEGTPTHPDHQCPACPVEVRDLFSAASNAVAQFRYSSASDAGWDRTYRNMRYLDESLARIGSIIDRHFVEMSTRCPQCGKALIGKPLWCAEHGEPGLAEHGEPGR